MPARYDVLAWPEHLFRCVVGLEIFFGGAEMPFVLYCTAYLKAFFYVRFKLKLLVASSYDGFLLQVLFYYAISETPCHVSAAVCHISSHV